MQFVSFFISLAVLWATTEPKTQQDWAVCVFAAGFAVSVMYGLRKLFSRK